MYIRGPVIKPEAKLSKWGVASRTHKQENRL